MQYQTQCLTQYEVRISHLDVSNLIRLSLIIFFHCLFASMGDISRLNAKVFDIPSLRQHVHSCYAAIMLTYWSGLNVRSAWRAVTWLPSKILPLPGSRPLWLHFRPATTVVALAVSLPPAAWPLPLYDFRFNISLLFKLMTNTKLLFIRVFIWLMFVLL